MVAIIDFCWSALFLKFAPPGKETPAPLSTTPLIQFIEHRRSHNTCLQEMHNVNYRALAYFKKPNNLHVFINANLSNSVFRYNGSEKYHESLFNCPNVPFENMIIIVETIEPTEHIEILLHFINHVKLKPKMIINTGNFDFVLSSNDLTILYIFIT